MGGSIGTKACRSTWVTVAVAAIVALMVGLLSLASADDAFAHGGVAATSSSTATTTSTSPTDSTSPTVAPTETPTGTPTPTETATPTAPPDSKYPEAQGWAHQMNGVKYHISSDGYVYFWTVKKDNYGLLSWEDYKGALPGDGTSFWFGDDPVRVKFAKCGVTSRMEVYGYYDSQMQTLPALPCKPTKRVDITRVKKLGALRVQVSGRTGMASQVRSSYLVVRDITKSTARRCAWVKPNGRLKFTRRVSGACRLVDAPIGRRLPAASSWSRVMKAPKRHTLAVTAVVRYQDGTVKTDLVRVRRR